MDQVLILLVMLAGGTHALFSVAETKCNATQNTSCSVPFGGSVYIQVMTSVGNHHQVWFKKGSTSVVTFRSKKVIIAEDFRNRTEFFITNGTVKITNVEKNDAGHYVVEIYDPNGVLIRRIHIQLHVLKHMSLTLTLIIAGSAAGALLILVLLFVVIRRRKSGSVKELRANPYPQYE